MLIIQTFGDIVNDVWKVNISRIKIRHIKQKTNSILELRKVFKHRREKKKNMHLRIKIKNTKDKLENDEHPENELKIKMKVTLRIPKHCSCLANGYLSCYIKDK